MAYGKAKYSPRLRYSPQFEPDFRGLGLTRLQRRQGYLLFRTHLAPTGNDRQIPVALKKNRAGALTIAAPPPRDARAEERPRRTTAETHDAASTPASGAFRDRERLAHTWPSAWAIVAALFLALVLVSSLTTTKSSLTQNEIARAAHHMPREHGIDRRL